jgi:hypothetical protein
MKMTYKKVTAKLVALMLLSTLPLAAQTPYQPKFPGDPARSDSEAAALGYMRTVLRAQRLYNRKNNKYASSLMELVHTGSFTRRMVNTDRGDYTAGFRPHKRKGQDKEGFDFTMTPKTMDAQHRSFYAGEDGIIHAEEDKAADENSPPVK